MISKAHPERSISKMKQFKTMNYSNLKLLLLLGCLGLMSCSRQQDLNRDVPMCWNAHLSEEELVIHKKKALSGNGRSAEKLADYEATFGDPKMAIYWWQIAYDFGYEKERIKVIMKSVANVDPELEEYLNSLQKDNVNTGNRREPPKRNTKEPTKEPSVEFSKEQRAKIEEFKRYSSEKWPIISIEMGTQNLCIEFAPEIYENSDKVKEMAKIITSEFAQHLEFHTVPCIVFKDDAPYCVEIYRDQQNRTSSLTLLGQRPF